MPLYLLFWYGVIINLVTFTLFGADKWKAAHGKWRFKESTLLWASFFGGAAGALLAMYLFHHKTQKLPFRLGVPAMLAVQTALIVFLARAGF